MSVTAKRHFFEGRDFPFKEAIQLKDGCFPDLFYTRVVPHKRAWYSGQWVFGWLVGDESGTRLEVARTSRYFDEVKKLLLNKDGESRIVTCGECHVCTFGSVDLML